MQEINKPNLMNIKLAYLALSFLVQRMVLICFPVFYCLRFAVTAFPRMNALGTYFKIDLGKGHLSEGSLNRDEDGYFTTGRKVTVMIKEIATLNFFTIDEAD